MSQASYTRRLRKTTLLAFLLPIAIALPTSYLLRYVVPGENFWAVLIAGLLVIVATFWACIPWWRTMDDMQRHGHMISWYWGGMAGGLVALIWLIAALGMTETFPVAQCYLTQEPWAVFSIFVAKGVTPIPFKLLTITAGFVHLPLWLFLVASLLSRTITFMIVGVLFRLFGAPIKRFIDEYLLLVTAAFVVFVIGGFMMIGLLGGGGDSEAAGPCDRPAAVTTV